MRRVGLWLGLVLVVPTLSGATDATRPRAADGGVAAGCTITLKARLDPGSLGAAGRAILYVKWGNSSRVRIKAGTWSALGGTGDPGFVIFHPDGTWKDPYANRDGSGE